MADYTTTAQKLWADTFKDAPAAAKQLLDIGDELINSGAFEPVEDAVTAVLTEHVAAILARIQTEMGVYAKFVGDLADDPGAAVTFILAKGDELINAGAMEPLMDGAMSLASPYLIAALTEQQAKLALVEITAED